MPSLTTDIDQAVEKFSEMNDEEAWSFLYDQFQKLGALLTKIIRPIVGHAKTEDIKTEIMIKVFNYRGKYDPSILPLKNWICLIARQIAINEYKKSIRSISETDMKAEVEDEDFQNLIDEIPSKFSNIENSCSKEHFAIVMKCIEKLANNSKHEIRYRIFKAFVFEGKKYSDILQDEIARTGNNSLTINHVVNSIRHFRNYIEKECHECGLPISEIFPSLSLRKAS